MRESKKILFLCTGNSCRSQMAEGFAKKFTSFQAYSAGTRKSNLNSYAIKVMSEVNIDISDQFSKTINELENKDFDYVFTLCSDAEENCPVLFKGKTIHKGFEDPPKLSENINDDEKILNIYRRVRDEILDFILNINHYI
jgi:arsenate reductase